MDWLLSFAQSPWLLCLGLAVLTFALEDAAILAGVGVAHRGLLPLETAIAAVAMGIILGDLLLYAAGLAARRSAWVEARLGGPRMRTAGARLSRNLVAAVLIARVVPGLRTVTYAAAGLFQANFRLFAGLVTAA
jgi:membrane protein DedA with SNARE-associated domain